MKIVPNREALKSMSEDVKPKKSRKKRTRYFIAIPLPGNRFAIALVAAHASRTLCLHCFAEAKPWIPIPERLAEFTPADVALVTLAMDDALQVGEWDIVGQWEGTDEDFGHMWGVPHFGCAIPTEYRFPCRVEYMADLQTTVRHPCSVREALRLDRDTIYDPVSLVRWLDRALNERAILDPFWQYRYGWNIQPGDVPYLGHL